MTWLVTGANGQLGSELRLLLGDGAVYVDREELDIADEGAVKAFLSNGRFEGVINCAAYTAVDRAEEEPEEAEKANHWGVRWLARYGKKIIHISTDYVFDGKNYVPWKEVDDVGPLSVYGKTKLAGERAVIEEAETAVIIRTAWVYSSYGNNFVKTMLRLGGTREKLTVVSDQVGTPTYARDLARAIVLILPQVKEGEKGLYQFTNEGVCSWYDFAVAIMEEAGVACRVVPIESKEYPTKAVRPYYSVLDKKKIKGEFGLAIRHWREALREMISELGKKA